MNDRTKELPEAFLEEMKTLLQEEYTEYLESFAKPCMQGIRVNTAKIAPETIRNAGVFALKEIPWAANGFYYSAGDAVTKHPWYYAGLYYVQEPSAMIPASRLPVVPGDFVLDLCAAPGGKATELGAKLRGRGMLLANDVSHSRAKALLKNLELAGVSNVYVSSENSERLKNAYPAFFDKILIDAPCSGEGMFRKDSAMIKDWTQKGPAYYAPIQRQLLLDAVEMLKPGGMLLYSTCTFSKQENEENIAFLLEQCPDMTLAEPQWNSCFTSGKKAGFETCIRMLPHRADGEGHFAALLQKKGAEEHRKDAVCSASEQTLPKALAENKEWMAFLSQIQTLPFGTFVVQKERVYLLPEGTKPKRGIRYLRTGLYLGDMIKSRFVPSQALAMCLRADTFARAVSFGAEDMRVIRYLKGETLDLSDTEWEAWKGWVLVCVDGYGLGWAKMINGTLKNKYYAGWRMQGCAAD